MSSVFDFLFQGSPPPSVTSTTQTQTGFPDWYQELMRANIGLATSTASQPYQPYTGQQVAGFTDPTKQAFKMTQDNIGAGKPALNEAQGALGQVAKGFDPTQFAKYMNPYAGGVAQAVQTMGNQNLMENILPGVNDTFTKAGQFGSTRNADFTSHAIRDAQTGISSAQEQALMSGMQNAMAAYGQGQQNQTIAGQQLGTLGQVQQNVGLKDAASLDQIGQEQQTQNQSGLNTGYQNYLNQLNYPYYNTNFLNSIIRGFPAPAAQSVISQTPQYGSMAGQPSPLSQGISAAGGSYYGGLGGLSQGSVPFTPIIGK